MGIFIAFIVFVVIGILALAVWCMIAYVSGRDDGGHYYNNYNNTHPMPGAYFYDAGYRHSDSESEDGLVEMNKKRFNRK